jgi:hypothetical protein
MISRVSAGWMRRAGRQKSGGLQPAVFIRRLALLYGDELGA